MKGKHCASIGSHERDDEGEELEPEHLEVEHVLGDVMWVRCDDDGTWWPAVVVNDNNISETSKPHNRSMGDVLVRLYGSYQYFYADPVKCRSEFEITLKENGGCYSEMFVEALEQDLPQSKSGQSKGKGSNSKGTSNGRASASKVKNSNQNRENCEIESSNHGIQKEKHLSKMGCRINSRGISQVPVDKQKIKPMIRERRKDSSKKAQVLLKTLTIKALRKMRSRRNKSLALVLLVEHFLEDYKNCGEQKSCKLLV
ncbi:uncharacterized protein [Populus alba]|uniref:uncharacterized protein isoform X2 n=1 Tax=Populus alba TaxID=43335 RepID=UPI00158D0B77|nr:uncharacterized protein LOC118036691 isoform X2 [Populus alba]XP_034898372.1 uncharacterized protein LOC118036691 isoform X2 [Populus alba]